MSGDSDVDDQSIPGDTAGWEMSDEKERSEKLIKVAWQFEEEGNVWTRPERYPWHILCVV